jgi:signal transduction histidine kinase
VSDDFPQLVSLACHDLRTPLATVQGFAKTLLQRGGVEGQAVRWLELIDSASDELVALLDELALAARIEAGRYEPVTREVDSLELARAAVPDAFGEGAPVHVDREPVEVALASLASALVRHGGVPVRVEVLGARVEYTPLVAQVAPIALGQDLKDLGAAVAGRVLRALGGSVEADAQRLIVQLPTRPRA